MNEKSETGFMERLVPHQSRLYRYIVSLVPQRADAEDLFQKTCLAAWKQRDAYDPSRDLFPWLCGIARNHVRHYYRGRAAYPVQLDPDVLEQLADQRLRDEALEEQRQRALDGCLGRLAPEDRAILEGYYRDDHPVKYMAAALGRSPDAVFKTLQRLRSSLHDCVSLSLGADPQ